jgi:hypothetical protein
MAALCVLLLREVLDDRVDHQITCAESMDDSRASEAGQNSLPV